VNIFTKILVIVNLLLCLVLSQYAWVSHADTVQWRQRYEWERIARHQDKSQLEDAYNELLAVRETNKNQVSRLEIELAARNATKQALEAWMTRAALSADDAEKTVNGLIEDTAPFTQISASYKESVVDSLQSVVGDLTTRKSDLLMQRGERLEAVAIAQDKYAEQAEEYRRVEFQQFLMQEELEHRLDTKARYRWLRPDIQRELGDNGPVIFANVQWVVGNSLQLDRGRRNGVELHQKYTISRGGSTVAIVDVVEVQNETCECIVVDLVNGATMPKAGDEGRTRLFMSRFGR
jgi:hypothetical protein